MDNLRGIFGMTRMDKIKRSGKCDVPQVGEKFNEENMLSISEWPVLFLGLAPLFSSTTSITTLINLRICLN